jgi:hypothetical protein
MAYAFTDPEVIKALRGVVAHPTYQFVEVKTKVVDSATGQVADRLYLFTNFTSAVSTLEVPSQLDSSVDSEWIPEYIDGVSAPARTGEVTQEVQRVEFKQALNYQFSDAGEDILTALGLFHNAEVICSAYVNANGSWKTTDPIYRTYGLVKSMAREVDSGGVIMETTSSFGKLQNVKELSTSPESLNKFIDNPIRDTSFDDAGKKHDREALEWGTG